MLIRRCIDSVDCEANSKASDLPWQHKKLNLIPNNRSLDDTIIHRANRNGRPAILTNESMKPESTAEVSPSNSAGDSSLNSPRSPLTPSQSTDKTSLESNISTSSTYISLESITNNKPPMELSGIEEVYPASLLVSARKGVPSRAVKSAMGSNHMKYRHWNKISHHHSNLAETVATVEKTAAAKVFFEHHYNNLTSERLTPRSLHQQVEIILGKEMTKSNLEKKEKRGSSMQHESNHLRKLRVMKARGSKALTGKYNPSSTYDVVKVLGKGSFGVVRLVREKCDKQ